jgi:hypothetical protein
MVHRIRMIVKKHRHRTYKTIYVDAGRPWDGRPMHRREGHKTQEEAGTNIVSCGKGNYHKTHTDIKHTYTTHLFGTQQ